MKKKQLYETPSVETYELVNEKFLCGSFDPTNNTEKLTNDGNEDLDSVPSGMM